MKKLLILMALSLGIVGCGSSSSDKSKIDVDFDQYKGSSITPSITEMQVEDGDQVVLNSRLTGTINTEYEGYRLGSGFEGLIGLFLTGEPEDLDLEIYSETTEYNSEGFTSNEVILMNALAEESYNINVYQGLGTGSFELTIVEATRKTLGLEDDEYLYSLSYTGPAECDGQSFTTRSHMSVLINFKKGYLEYLDALDKFSFYSIEGNSFHIDSAESIQRSDGLFENEANFQLDVNSANGNISGTAELATTEPNSECSASVSIEGRILL